MNQETYLISEAARELQVENHVLRYWEEELEITVKRNEKGHRYYSGEDLEQLRRIKLLKEKGLQLKAIKMILRNGNLEQSAVLMRMESSIQENESLEAEDTGVEFEHLDEEVLSKPENDDKALLNKKQIIEKITGRKGNNGKRRNSARNRKYQAARAKRINKSKLLCPVNDTASQNHKSEKTEGEENKDHAEALKDCGRKDGLTAQDHAEALKDCGRKDGLSAQDHAEALKDCGRKDGSSAQDHAEKLSSCGQKDGSPAQDHAEKLSNCGQEDASLTFGQAEEYSSDDNDSMLTDPFDEKQEKAFRLQLLLQTLIADAVRENNLEICENVKDGILKEMDYYFRELDQREEERDQKRIAREERHYKKMDELIRSKLEKNKRKKHSLF